MVIIVDCLDIVHWPPKALASMSRIATFDKRKKENYV